MPRKPKRSVDPVSLAEGLSILEGGSAQPSAHAPIPQAAKGASARGGNVGRSASTDVGSSLKPGMVCPHCHYGILESDPSFSGTPCEFFVYCPTCDAHICTYRPMPHQEEFHRDPHKHKMYAGGFGSAKTYTCGMEFLAICLQIPGTVALMGAGTWGQVQDTCLKFVLDNLPKALVARSNQDKVNYYIQLVNGTRISAKALDQEGKIRSMNLSLIWIEEASEVDWSVVAFIMARLRNKVGIVNGHDRLRMLLSTNPDVGWPNEEWLMRSGAIYYHGAVDETYKVPADRQDPSRSTHISATSANIYLPKDYEANLARGKPDWWVRRYLKGSFRFSEGLVYPNFASWFVDPFPIPAHWRRVTGTDFGRNDPTAHVIGALDPVNKVIYVYDCLEEELNDRPAAEIVRKIAQKNDYPKQLMAFPPRCDPRGSHKDQVSGQTWIDTFRDCGYPVYPAPDCGPDSLVPTINKLYSYAKYGRLRIFRTCTQIYEELSKYRYPPKTLSDKSNAPEKPVDKHNHLPDALRYMLSDFPNFPDDPNDFPEVWRTALIERTLSNRAPGHYNYLSNDEPEGYITDVTDLFG